VSSTATQAGVGQPERSNRPHVVMLVGNDIAVDTRVKKTAVSLERLGLRVTVVGYGATGRESARMAGCDIVRVPIPWTHKNAGQLPLPAPMSPRTEALLRLQDYRTSVISWGTRPGHRPIRAARKGLKLAGLFALRVGGAVVRRSLSDEVPKLPVQEEPSLPWRAIVPIATDYVEAFTPEIVALRPDVIHAHDVHTIAAARTAVDQLEAETGTRPLWLYDAHEFIAGLSLYGRRNATERAGWLNLEQEFAPHADAIVTVSPDLATELARRYPEVPHVRVVLNSPWRGEGTAEAPDDGGVRGTVGIDADVPLLVYSGVVTDARGVRTAIEAMPHLPRCHLAIVSTTYASPLTQILRDRAAELEVADRVHIVPPVPAQNVVAHLSTADIGLIPIKRFPSHDVALTNKLFEYIHAGLPVVVSDCPAQKRFVRTEDIGAVHITEDAEDFALAVTAVIEDLEHYRGQARRADLIERFSWQGAEAELAALYTDLLGTRFTADPTGAYPSLHEEQLRSEEQVEPDSRETAGSAV